MMNVDLAVNKLHYGKGSKSPRFSGLQNNQKAYLYFQGKNAAVKTTFTGNQEAKVASNYALPFTSIYDTKGLKGIKATNLSFKGYWGMDDNPVKKLMYVLTGEKDNKYTYDPKFAMDHLFTGIGKAGWKRWVYAHPAELLRRSLSDSIMTMTTLAQSDIPDHIKTPDHGNDWGQRANFIEIIPRVLGKMDKDRSSEGIFGAIKMLPAIPASQDGIANCVILSQLYPTIYGDGWAKGGYEESSQYTTNLNVGISQDLVSGWAERDGVKVTPEEQIKAFNDLAHFRGLKTGFRMNLSADQMRVNGGPFNWAYNENDFINACCHAVNLGFDSIFFDSAKHVGGYDMGNYHGCGGLPNYQQMQYILSEVRHRTGRGDVNFIGEMCSEDPQRYKNMGLNAGTGSRHSCWGFASGEPISNMDNDWGSTSYDDRLKNINHGLFDDHNGQKMPMFMNMADIFPLNWNTNVHDLMVHNKSFTSYGDPESHWNNIFAGDDAANNYRYRVNEKFAYAAAR